MWTANLQFSVVLPEIFSLKVYWSSISHDMVKLYLRQKTLYRNKVARTILWCKREITCTDSFWKNSQWENANIRPTNGVTHSAFIKYALIVERCAVKLQKTLTCVAVVHCLCDGFLQVGKLDLLSVPSSLPVLQCHFVNHLFSCGAAGETLKTQSGSINTG